jgi:hypothetical protein
MPVVEYILARSQGQEEVVLVKKLCSPAKQFGCMMFSVMRCEPWTRQSSVDLA